MGELIVKGRKVWVLSDPDVLSNHGLGKAGNPVFAGRVDQRHPGRTAGRSCSTRPSMASCLDPVSPLRMLFEFPFYIVSLQGARRRGPAAVGDHGAVRLHDQTSRPRWPAGKQELLDNVARLMEYAGHHKVMLHRYVHSTVRDAGRQIHAPRNLDGAELVEWLQRAGSRERRDQGDCADILHRADELLKEPQQRSGDRSSALARDIYRWKREIIDGPSRNPQGDRSGSR